MNIDDMLAFSLSVLFTLAIVGVLWVLPIIQGVKSAKRKNLSPHWMWFGIHPFGAWIAYAIIRFAASEKTFCPHCHQMAVFYKGICPVCKGSLEQEVEKELSLVDEELQAIIEKRNRDKLNTLSIFHYVFAGFTLLSFGFMYLHYKLMKYGFTSEECNLPEGQQIPFYGESFFEVFQWLYVAFAIMGVIAIIMNLLGGVFLRKLEHRTICIVVAAINCLFFPFGTILGITTITNLQKDEFRSLFKS